MSYRKLFHLLLPLSQIAFFVSSIVFNMYCIEIKDQRMANTLITSLGGYILVLCFLINALHWAFLTSQSDNIKMRGCIVGVIMIVFVITPLAFEASFVYYNIRLPDVNTNPIHLVELIYASILNVIVMIVVFFSWFVLHRRLKEFSGLHTINKLKTRLIRQMSLYVILFFIRAACMFFGGIFGFENIKAGGEGLRLTLFFVSGVFGDFPLALVMLHFLSHKTSSSASSSPSNPSSTGGGGQGVGPQPNYQYASSNKINSGDNSPDLTPQYTNPPSSVPDLYLSQSTNEIIFTNTPPQYVNGVLQQQAVAYAQYPQYPQNAPYYYSPQVAGMDPSLSSNSYYNADGGYV